MAKQPNKKTKLHTISVDVRGTARASIECVEGESFKLLANFEARVRDALEGCEFMTDLDDVRVTINLGVD